MALSLRGSAEGASGNHADRRQPLEHRAEVAQRVAADTELDVVGIDEIQPEAIAHEHECAAIGGCDDESGHRTFTEEMISTLPAN